MMLSIWVGEVTNPFNILRQYFEAHENKRRETQMGIIFIVSFIFFRAFSTPYVVGYNIILNPNINFPLKFLSALMYFVGLVWTWKIINMGLKTMSQVSLGHPR